MRPLFLALFAAFMCGCETMPGPVVAHAVIAAGRATNGRLQLAVTRGTSIPLKRVTARKANPAGKILILEYHKLDAKNGLLDRTPASFRKDLNKLYKLGYRPVTLSQWLDGTMPLAPGASPVVFTFDDSHESQLKFKSDGSIDPNCFVGIWAGFAKKHPDFPIHATFFVLPPVPFGQSKFTKAKIELLEGLGSEIDSHTYHHKDLARCTDEQVKEEIADSLDWLQKDFGITNVSLAFPYGIRPRNLNIVEGFMLRGKEYHLRSTLLAAGEPAESTSSKKFNPWLIHRVVVCEKPGGSTDWLKIMSKGKKYAPYVAP